MRPGSLIVVLSTVVWLSMPANAAAQNRERLWFGVGGGFGSAGVSCSDCGNTDREGSGSFYVKGSWTLNPRTLLGVELNAWTKNATIEDGLEGALNFYNIAGTLTYYPRTTTNFFVKGGAGIAIIDMDVSGTGSSTNIDLGKGLGVIVGAGYDIPLGRRVALTPAVNFWYGQPGDLQVLGEPVASKWKQNVVDFTIGITFP
jgi:hypothetical protein